MIQKIIVILLLLSSSIMALDWEKDLDNALQKAQKEHKNLMVMVEGEHCRWCKKMKGRTLTDEGIEKRLQKYVIVKVFREDSGAMSKLPPVDGVPTIFFMKPNKAVIQEILGYEDVSDFNVTLNDVDKRLK